MSASRLDPRVERGMRAQLALRKKRIAAGEKPLGWKVGFGAPAAMKKLEVEAPLMGFLMVRALLRTGSITPPIGIEAGDDIRFELEPVGNLSANFTT